MSTVQENVVVMLDSFAQALNKVKGRLNKYGGNQVGSKIIRADVKKIVHFYFNEIRASLVNENINIETLDQNIQLLFILTNKNALKSSYIKTIKDIINDIPTLQIKKFTLPNKEGKNILINEIESKIITTLDRIVPSLGVSYQQVVMDLADQGRKSFRGTTAELREIVRELLDKLAPDESVKEEKTFKFEVGTNKPTMKQKVNFILRARMHGKTEMKVTEDTTSMIDNHSQDAIAAIARSTYARGSAGTHTDGGSQRSTCKQYKMYVDSVLGELLEIHSSN